MEQLERPEKYPYRNLWKDWSTNKAVKNCKSKDMREKWQKYKFAISIVVALWIAATPEGLAVRLRLGELLIAS